MSLQRKEKEVGWEVMNFKSCSELFCRIYYENSSSWTGESSWQKRAGSLSKHCSDLFRIMPVVSKSQLGKHGVCLKKTVCIDKTVESNLAFYTTVEILFRNPTSIL